ncbi:MAG: endonuclease/exonuclease/phosphatase family protein [Candidatus Omnitrophota bacterium]|nr:endonuclease/exonuclease/phosphatase family protein [Candidatus Omnitrophota bacterium]
MIQIDGLSRPEFQKALDQGSLPFLRRLRAREGYVAHPHYSGLPSNTPAVQAELFYGVKGGVPAFSFVDRDTRQVVKMYESGAASAIEQRLRLQGAPLLEGGSAYSDIFTGGAAEAHFCAAKPGWDGVLRALNPALFPFLIVLHFDVFVWVALLMLLECGLAIASSARAVIKGKLLLPELLFILTRIGPVILLRELVVRGVQIDIARGLPIIHMNLIGYDDHAHHRGPHSSFARWPLQGMDWAVARVWRAADRSRRRNYDVWVYSDHGQELSVPYQKLSGMTLAEAIKPLYDGALSAFSPDHWGENEYPYRTGRTIEPMSESPASPRVLVTAMGPVAHVYPQPEFVGEQRDRLAQALVQSAQVPVVAALDGAESVRIWTDEGDLRLPNDAARLFGVDHPFLEEVTQDLLTLCRHPSAGALVLFGWRAGREPVSFQKEYGAHAGFGPEETHGFALLPVDAPLPPRERKYLRPLDLREAALRHLGRSLSERPDDGPPSLRPVEGFHTSRSLRVMTYNVHRCIGLDGKVSPERIARIIARHEPDIIALQELDVGQQRTHRIDQAERIARLLRMSYQFHPVIDLARGRYGNAILSRYPMRLMQAEQLPQLRNLRYLEPRGGLWVTIDIDGVAVQVINCHLSIWPTERFVQAGALAGARWLADPRCQSPVVFCGDLNAMPGSPTYRRLMGAVRDSQSALKTPSLRTWSSRYPVSRIDHIFISPDITVSGVTVPWTMLDQIASDHLPLLVQMSLRRENVEAKAV